MQRRHFNQGCALRAVRWTRPPLHRPVVLFSSLKMTHFFTLCPLLHHFLSLGLCQKVPLHMAARFPVGHWQSTALTYEARRQCSALLNKHALAQTAVVASHVHVHALNASSRREQQVGCLPSLVHEMKVPFRRCWTQEDGLKSRLHPSPSRNPDPNDKIKLWLKLLMCCWRLGRLLPAFTPSLNISICHISPECLDKNTSTKFRSTTGENHWNLTLWWKWRRKVNKNWSKLKVRLFK